MLRKPSTWFSMLHKKTVIYPTLKLYNANIERVSQFHFLGVALAATLKWDKHIGHVSLKVSRVIGVLFRLKHIYLQEVLLTLYNTLILTHVSYCILVWGTKIQTNYRLHLLQKKAVRIITNKDYIAHTEPLCKLLNILKEKTYCSACCPHVVHPCFTCGSSLFHMLSTSVSHIVHPCFTQGIKLFTLIMVT